jgi:hypothetical protein
MIMFNAVRREIITIPWPWERMGRPMLARSVKR